MGRNIISASQMRGARGILDWSQDNLAEASGLSIGTIRKLELGNVSPRGATNCVIRAAFENAGLEFLEPNGIRQKPEEIAVYDGSEGVRKFLDDVYETSLKMGAEIIQTWPSVSIFENIIGEHRAFHVERMMAIRDHIKVKTIHTEEYDYAPAPYVEYRFLSRHFVDSVPFYVYGDKFAIIPLATQDHKKIIVIESRAAAQAFRAQFKSMWDRAAPMKNTASRADAPNKRTGHKSKA